MKARLENLRSQRSAKGSATLRAQAPVHVWTAAPSRRWTTSPLDTLQNACRMTPSHSCNRLAAPSARHTRALRTAAFNLIPEPVLASEDELLEGLEGPVLVWFKSDLRAGDHPGLLSAQRAGCPVVPFFCLDPQLYKHLAFTPAGAHVLLDAVAGLRSELQAAGSDLVVRTGQADFYLPALCQYAGIRTVLVQQEVEAQWCERLDQLEQLLAAAGVQLLRWSSHAWPQQSFSNNYRTWKQQRGSSRPPLPAPPSLPALPADVEAGVLPDAGAVARLLAGAATVSTDAVVEQQASELAAAAAACPQAGVMARLLGSGFSTAQLLDAYLRRDVQGLPRELSWLREELAGVDSPAAPHASLAALLGPSLVLGRMSRRQVLAAAEEFERQRYGGWLPPTGVSSPSAKAAVKLAETAEFHWQLAEKGRQQEQEQVAGSSGRQCWRWRGMLTDYFMAEPQGGAAAGAPAILLVHGFGAFGDQWRGNLGPLAAAGYRVYAPTLPGFGRSEKAPVAYSQDGWRDFLRDFIVQVVRGPVVLVGNSIGGFISASLAADYPSLAAGLVLINSAGPIDDSYSPAVPAKPRSPPPSLVASAISLGLLAYLERSIQGTLKWLYPTNPQAADEWLGEEIYRAACDLGSFEVFRSVFYLPPPRPLNHLVGVLYRGPARVLQGSLDPLNDARGRAAQLASLCGNVDVVLLEAGHCPHDEQPGLVNDGIVDFVQQRVVAQQAVSATV